jgi:arsenite-transporting ATPase
MLLKDHNELLPFQIDKFALTKYLFFTGKGGVGKTSVACALAVSLADAGKKVLLISTDPASNLQDVFGLALNGKGVVIPQVPTLVVANLNPEEAAGEYRESVIAPYRGKLPESVINNMEEQLSGSCTVEIAAFDQFSRFITAETTANSFDHILFDTAPTGHTLRMLQLPSAWTNFISESTHGASCLGQLAGLQQKKEIYKRAVENLSDAAKTKIVLISRPEKISFLEVKRSSDELATLNIRNQMLIINGLLHPGNDDLSRSVYEKQQTAIASMSEELKRFKTYGIPLRSYNILGLESIRAFLTREANVPEIDGHELPPLQDIQKLIDDIYDTGKKVVFTMGKGGVGKTSVAASIARGLAKKGLNVHLTTTDPANHLKYEQGFSDTISVSSIDEAKELNRYREEVLSKARETMNEADVAYVEEDLRSPCTQEIAVFRAFAEIVDKADEKVVIIDTAPTGHTLLLLDSTLSYHKEVERTKGEIPLSVQKLLPRLRDSSQTDVVIVTLPEATPVFEATRLMEDLKRAGIKNKWWVVNQSLFMAKTTDPLLKARAINEKKWIKRVMDISKNYCAVIPLNLEGSINYE